MQFREVIGQKEMKKQLVQLYRQKRLGHALLFLAREGTGGLPMALAFSQFLVCEKVHGRNNQAAAPSLFGEPEPQVSAAEELMDSCGECPACRKASGMIHPDIHFSYPVIPKRSGDKPISTDYVAEWREFIKENPYGNRYDWIQHIGAENQQGNITANECHDIIRKMSLKSFEAPYKILIMWMPELLGNDGNRLLKLFEEPPEDTLFILVAENQGLILPTILSRLQLIKIPQLTRQDLEAALELRESVPMEKAERIAAISDGNYHEALQLLLHADEDWEPWLRTWLNNIIRANREGQVKWIEDISKTGREKQKQFLKYFSHLVDIAIRVKMSGETGPSYAENQSSTEFALRLNKQFDYGQMDAIANELNQAAFYIERNANAKILFHALTIKLYHIITNKSVILIP